MPKITNEQAMKNLKKSYSMVTTKMTQEKVWEYERNNIEIQIYVNQKQKQDKLLDLYDEFRLLSVKFFNYKLDMNELERFDFLNKEIQRLKSEMSKND